jgi:hypothetical protein
MTENVETLSIDLRYENYRLKNPKFEDSLLSSISKNGIKEPLFGTSDDNCNILLDGFKRFRCARKLSIKIIPFEVIADDQALGIIKLLRLSGNKKMNILEQARLIDELVKIFNMSYSEIAFKLEKSKAWVAMRAGVIEQMSDFVREQIFNGSFPAYSFLYTLRSFIRMNGIKNGDINGFVKIVGGKGLSIRDIDLLAKSHFRGDMNLTEHLKSSDIHWHLKNLKEEKKQSDDNCNLAEKKMLKNLEICSGYINRVIYSGNDARIKSNDFFSQAGLLAEGTIKRLDRFKSILEGFCDR